MATKKLTAKQRSNSERIQIRATEVTREKWQALADRAAGFEGAPLGPYLRDMIDAGIAASKAVRK